MASLLEPRRHRLSQEDLAEIAGLIKKAREEGR
jgi:DNA-directed RNA polymerase subunit F